MSTLFLLLLAHCLADFPLQGDYLARAKNHCAPLPGVPWPLALFAHSTIHGGAVYLVTGSLALGACEIAAHAAIDYAKSGNRITYAADQALHVACKVAWFGLAVA